MLHPITSPWLDEQTVIPVDSEWTPIRTPTVSKRPKCELGKEYDEIVQLSHGFFEDKGSVCFDAFLNDPKYGFTNEIVRVTNEEMKMDTCTLNNTIFCIQNSRQPDERSLRCLPKLDSKEWAEFMGVPVLVAVEKKIVGHQLFNEIYSCGFSIGPQRLEHMASLFVQICDGMAFLHENGFTHNDIAPDNIMVENGRIRIKIIDFDSAVKLNNPSHRPWIDEDGTVLHEWLNMQLYHKEPYRALECWKAFELRAANRQCQVFLDLKAADTCALLLVFWEMLMEQCPPVHHFTGAKALVDKMVDDMTNFGEMPRHGQMLLKEEFRRGFDDYVDDVMEGLNQYGDQSIRDNLENIFGSLDDMECRNMSDPEKPIVVKVKRDSVDDILKLEWLRRYRTV